MSAKSEAEKLLSSWTMKLDAPTEELRCIESLLAELEDVGKQNTVLRATNKRLEEMVSEKGVDRLVNIFDAAEKLAEVKHHKDHKGKDDWYEIHQPAAWIRLFKALQDYKEEV